MHVHKWALETLVNELFAGPKAPTNPGPNRRVDCSKFAAIVQAYNTLHALEEAHDVVVLERMSVLQEVQRIGHRQFPWQGRADNLANLYRSLLLFGGPEASAYFESKHGIALAKVVLSGFVIFVLFAENSATSRIQQLPDFGLSGAEFSASLSLISLTHEAARQSATEMRCGRNHISYKGSFLRRHPCILFGDRVRAPLRQLIFSRVTAGLYYDIVPAGGDVTREIGERFEQYCVDLMPQDWPGVTTHPSYKYTVAGKTLASPDLLLREGSSLRLIGECKAKRMPFNTRFGEDPQSDPEAQLGFDEVAKGVFQIWRFASHVRRGLVSEQMHSEALGLVVTLDPWLSMAVGRYEDLIRRARSLSERDPDILEQDRIPVAFSAIEDLEQALMKASLESFVGAIREAADAEFAGWHFSAVHDRQSAQREKRRRYPFQSRVSEVLPWWKVIDERRSDSVDDSESEGDFDDEAGTEVA